MSLGAALERALAVIRSSVVESGAVIDAAELPSVAGRAAELELLLQNLLVNSIRYRAAVPPRISITATREGAAAWVLRFRDNGRGIPPEVRDRVFEPFVRGGADERGSGLGLATCRRIAERHGGRIWVEETGEGGTVIALTLRSAPGMDGAFMNGRTGSRHNGSAAGADNRGGSWGSADGRPVTVAQRRTPSGRSGPRTPQVAVAGRSAALGPDRGDRRNGRRSPPPAVDGP